MKKSFKLFLTLAAIFIATFSLVSPAKASYSPCETFDPGDVEYPTFTNYYGYVTSSVSSLTEDEYVEFFNKSQLVGCSKIVKDGDNYLYPIVTIHKDTSAYDPISEGETLVIKVNGKATKTNPETLTYKDGGLSQVDVDIVSNDATERPDLRVNHVTMYKATPWSINRERNISIAVENLSDQMVYNVPVVLEIQHKNAPESSLFTKVAKVKDGNCYGFVFDPIMPDPHIAKCTIANIPAKSKVVVRIKAKLYYTDPYTTLGYIDFADSNLSNNKKISNTITPVKIAKLNGTRVLENDGALSLEVKYTVDYIRFSLPTPSLVGRIVLTDNKTRRTLDKLVYYEDTQDNIGKATFSPVNPGSYTLEYYAKYDGRLFLIEQRTIEVK